MKRQLILIAVLMTCISCAGVLTSPEMSEEFSATKKAEELKEFQKPYTVTTIKGEELLQAQPRFFRCNRGISFGLKVLKEERFPNLIPEERKGIRLRYSFVSRSGVEIFNELARARCRKLGLPVLQADFQPISPEEATIVFFVEQPRKAAKIIFCK